MTRARAGAAGLVVAIVIGAAVAVAVLGREPRSLGARAPRERPALLLLTSLPLMLGEDFSLEQRGSAALTALETRYKILPISVTDTRDLAGGRLLLMAHPAAQTPEDLVALDNWVRGGGRVLLLADPMLEWPSSRSLGDPLRPSPMFVDTGLLAHWGLRLDAPDERGPQRRKLARYDVVTESPGALHGDCDVARDGFVASCRIGQGRAIIIADADFLDAERLGEPARHNLDAMLAELETLERG